MQGYQFESAYLSEPRKSRFRADAWSPPDHRDLVVSTIVKAFIRAEADSFLEAHLHQAASKASSGVAKFYESSLVQGQLSIRMEHGELGSLLDKLSLLSNSRVFFEPETLLKLCVSMLKTLADVHGARIAHRRIDVTNWVLTRTGEVKLIDFGHAKLIQESDTTAGHTIRGLEMYLSPQTCAMALSQEEIIINIFKEDVWALGKVMYEMSTLKVFRYLNTVPRDVLNADITRKCTNNGYLQLVSPLLAMLEWDYKLRPNASEALSLLLAQGNTPEKPLILEENEGFPNAKTDFFPIKKGEDNGRSVPGDSSEPTTEPPDSVNFYLCECCKTLIRSYVPMQNCEHKVCFSCMPQNSLCPLCSQKITFPIPRKRTEVEESQKRVNQAQSYEKVCPFCSHKGEYRVSGTPVVCANCHLTSLY